MKVYIAASLGMAEWIDRIVAEAVRSKGAEIVSTWHRYPYVTVADEEALTEERAAKVRKLNMRELAGADVCLVVASRDGGEHLAEGAIAYDAGKTLVWTGRLTLTARQPRVIRCGTVPETYGAIADLVASGYGRGRQIGVGGRVVAFVKEREPGRGKAR